MSTAFQKFELLKFFSSFYIFQEVNCIPGVSKSFEERWQLYTGAYKCCLSNTVDYAGLNKLGTEKLQTTSSIVRGHP